MYERTRGFFLTVALLTGFLSSSHGEVVREPIPYESATMSEFTPMVRFDKAMRVFDTTGNALEDPNDLCSPNLLYSWEIVAYEECCQEDSDGDCTGNRDCRRRVATCIGTDGEPYPSFGAPECEECIVTPPEDAVEYESPFCSF